jgi:transcriptional regulator with XRE-family HTH domain
MSQAQLAEYFCVTPGNVSHIETNKQALTLKHAGSLIDLCLSKGIVIGLDDVFIYPNPKPNGITQESD